MTEREKLLHAVQMYDFVLTEANLYLDGHPDNREAAEYFQPHKKLHQAAVERYEAEYGPLTARSANPESQKNWIDGPWPWELEEEAYVEL